VSLHQQLLSRQGAGTPIRVGLIGAGKFGSMFLAQVQRTPGMHVLGIADLAPERARAALHKVGWSEERYAAKSFSEAFSQKTTCIVDDSEALIAAPGLDVVIDATGSPSAGVRHALLAIHHGRHIVMVNVEADVLAGPLLAEKAAAAGVIYSMAYGDQPALIAEMVDWARTVGLDVVCAGKGTKYLPQYHESTPDTVWNHYGFTAEQLASGDFNPNMFNSFLDGTKSAIEMAAVANATGLAPPDHGLVFPPCGVDDLPSLLRPRADGGILDGKGMVEVVSSLERDGSPVFRDLRWGVFAVFEASSDYVRRCFSEYGLKTDASGNYAAMYKPYHLIGLELGFSVASIMLRKEATGVSRQFAGDAVATAKRDLKAGEMLDGEGGFTVYGKLMPAAKSLTLGALPIGLAHGVRLTSAVARGQTVGWHHVAVKEEDKTVAFRREMEKTFKNR
jgi:predicted homoserine dehydrogenase-like protein